MEFMRVKTDEEKFSEMESMLRSYNPDVAIHGRYYTAEENGIKGVVGLLWRSWYLTEIRHLYVRPEFREKAVGTFLVKEVLKQINTPVACCTVNADNIASGRLFGNIGFQEIKRFINSNTGSQVILMFKAFTQGGD